MKRVIIITLLPALGLCITLKAQIVAFPIKNDKFKTLNCRYLNGKEIVASGLINAGNSVSQNREAGLTFQTQCIGKQIIMGSFLQIEPEINLP
ncbi:MAG: hypothetical protein MH137_10170 [Flavobacteriales bacterium]|nr:hypothetical protein [Flavobacteriales bacterium]